MLPQKQNKLLFRIVFFGLFLFFSYQYSNAFTDEVKQELTNLQNPVQRIERLEHLTDSLYGVNLSQAKKYTQLALQIAEESEQFDLIGRANLLAGTTWIELTNYDSAAYYLNLALSDFKEYISPVFQAEIIFNQAKIQLNKKNYAEAYAGYFEALRIWENQNYELGVAKAKVGIGEVYSYEKDFTEAIKYTNQAIPVFEKNNHKALLAMAYMEIAYNYLFLGDYDGALLEVNKALSELDGVNKPIYLAKLYNARGNIYKHTDKYDEALKDYQQNLKFCKLAGSLRGEMVSTANIGHALLLKKDYESALPYTLKAIKIMEDTDDRVNLWENYMHLSDIYAGIGDHEKATQYVWAYSEEVERLFEEKYKRMGMEIEEKYETGKREATIVLQKEKIDQQNTIQLLGAGILGLLALLGALLFYFLRKSQKNSQALKIKNDENELLLKEIHHRVKNNLEMVSSLLMLQSAKTKDSAAREVMNESHRRVQSMGIIHQKLYQGENLASIEMVDYFKNLSENILDAFDAHDKVEIEYEMNELELDVDTAVPIGLIVNELLNNALKYAFPNNSKGKIKLSLKEENTNGLILSVEDNGIGMNENEEAKGTGFGRQLVQLLTTQLQGTMQSDYNNGTSLTFQLEKAYVS